MMTASDQTSMWLRHSIVCARIAPTARITSGLAYSSVYLARVCAPICAMLVKSTRCHSGYRPGCASSSTTLAGLTSLWQ